MSVTVAPNEFHTTRNDITWILMNWSQGLIDDLLPDDIANSLERIAQYVEAFKPLARGTTGICFRPRCTLIAQAMEDAAQELRALQVLTLEIAELIDMFAQQIGRLTLYGYSDEDVFAVEMSRGAQGRELEWQTRRPVPDEEVERKQVKVRVYWVRMHLLMPQCGCRQCCQVYPPMVARDRGPR